MPPSSIDAPWPVIRRASRTVVVVDLVESVRLYELDEEGTVRRWQGFVRELVTDLLPRYGGRLVKSTGDGLMLEFEAVPPAIDCASDMHRIIERTHADVGPEAWMGVRIGAHVADVYVDEHDIYGRGVNLAARLTTLAHPGETVVSSAVRDGLTAGLDAEIEDIGSCFLKHLREPVQAYRVGSRRVGLVVPPPERAPTSMRPTVAVVPFAGLNVQPPFDVVGELIADGVIAQLSTSDSIRVISRLSTSVMSARQQTTAEVGVLLGATFVVSGSYRVLGDRVLAMVELCDTRSQEVIWAEQVAGSLGDILQVEGRMADTLSAHVMAAVSVSEMRRVQRFPLPTLHGYSLLLAGTALMHRSSLQDFNRSREVFEHLIERYPRVPEPRAWLAKWYVLRVTRGLVESLEEESARALEHTRRALDTSPDCSLALAIEGFVHCHMLRDLPGADERLDRALQANPNDSLAWLFKCVTQGFRGEGDAALTSAERAIALSPLDPMRHYYDALACSAALCAGSLTRAIELASRSLQANRNHLPTLRALAIAQVEAGLGDEARQTATRILHLEPGFTLRDYLARGPKGGEANRSRYATALQEAGIPPG